MTRQSIQVEKRSQVHDSSRSAVLENVSKCDTLCNIHGLDVCDVLAKGHKKANDVLQPRISTTCFRNAYEQIVLPGISNSDAGSNG